MDPYAASLSNVTQAASRLTTLQLVKYIHNILFTINKLKMSQFTLCYTFSVRAMFRVCEITALCIQSRISPPRAPNSSLIASSTSVDHPPKTSMMIVSRNGLLLCVQFFFTTLNHSLLSLVALRELSRELRVINYNLRKILGMTN